MLGLSTTDMLKLPYKLNTFSLCTDRTGNTENDTDKALGLPVGNAETAVGPTLGIPVGNTLGDPVGES